MAKPTSRADRQRHKAARQKKLIIGLLPVLAILAFLQVPKLLHRQTGNVGVSVSAPIEQATAVTAAANARTASLAPTLGAPTSATTAAVVVTGSGMANPDAPLAPEQGQLVVFDLFASKDPFEQQAGTNNSGGSDEAAASATAAAAAAPTSTPSQTTSGSAPSAAASGPTTSVAYIATNGKAEPVQAKDDFPASAPVFHLVSFTSTAAKIAVVDGAYQDGQATLTLERGKPVTLLNTADGTRYVIVFQRAAKVPTSSLPTPAPATTTTTTTTTPAGSAAASTTPTGTVTPATPAAPTVTVGSIGASSTG